MYNLLITCITHGGYHSQILSYVSAREADKAYELMKYKVEVVGISKLY